MKTEKFCKYDIKNIVTEALINIELDEFLKDEFKYEGRKRDDYYDAVDRISDDIIRNHFE